jgi:DNA-binding response OmpR family regulator
LRILFVDNHREFTAVVVPTFLAAHAVTVVPTIEAAKAALDGSTLDVVLVDYDLDDGKGVELVRWVRTVGLPVRLIAVSARSDGNDALLAAGANRACPKTEFARIATVLASLDGTPS